MVICFLLKFKFLKKQCTLYQRVLWKSKSLMGMHT